MGLAFYNNVLIPTGLLLLAAMAAAPLLRWGKQPAGVQRRMLWLAALAGGLAVVVAAFCGLGQPIHLAVVALAIFAAAALAGALLLDARRASRARRGSPCSPRWASDAANMPAT